MASLSRLIDASAKWMLVLYFWALVVFIRGHHWTIVNLFWKLVPGMEGRCNKVLKHVAQVWNWIVRFRESYEDGKKNGDLCYMVKEYLVQLLAMVIWEGEMPLWIYGIGKTSFQAQYCEHNFFKQLLKVKYEFRNERASLHTESRIWNYFSFSVSPATKKIFKLRFGLWYKDPIQGSASEMQPPNRDEIRDVPPWLECPLS